MPGMSNSKLFLQRCVCTTRTSDRVWGEVAIGEGGWPFGLPAGVEALSRREHEPADVCFPLFIPSSLSLFSSLLACLEDSVNIVVYSRQALTSKRWFCAFFQAFHM